MIMILNNKIIKIIIKNLLIIFNRYQKISKKNNKFKF